MPLSDLQVRSAKPGEKVAKLSDGGGLQLWINPDGSKYWRLAYRFDGKQKVLAIGVYPKVGLKEAREARENAKRLLAEGRDPSFAKKIAKASRASSATNSFDGIAAELRDKKEREGKAAGTLNHWGWLLSLAKPTLGSRPIGEIAAPEVLAALRVVEARGRHETARKMRGAIGEVFRYAVATGRAQSDPTPSLKGALTAPVVTNRAAIVEPKAFGGLLRAIEGYQGAPETKAALELLASPLSAPANFGRRNGLSSIWTRRFG
jgi:hypothetical protein